MGERPVPGSTGRLDAGGARQYDHLAKFGRGRIIDEETGEYETYQIPDGYSEAEEFTWSQAVDVWELIVCDFASEYPSVRMAGLSWREFEMYVIGLRTADTRLSRWIARDQDNDDEPKEEADDR